uniref:Olfactory receptor n=1 Tax=Gopherus evgoodei TaxID=1825980 RepID=A0A8C4Y8K4_9SAUR
CAHQLLEMCGFQISALCLPDSVSRASDNHTDFYPVTYILTGIPGTEVSHFWMAIPFCLMYVVTLFGNFLLLFIILTEQSLHEPMYVFVSMLATADLLLSTTTVPKILAVFWFRAGEISFAACLTQMFFIHVSFLAESAILLAMAFDRYVAICDPLRYTIILTKSVIGKMGLAIVTRSFCFIFPIIFLVKRLKFCRTNLLPHTYCEHMVIARLACDDITVSIWYVITSDLTLIALSYGLIIKAVLRLSSKKAHQKALNTCTVHICVMLTYYTPGLFSNLTSRLGQGFAPYIHIILADLYLLIPPLLNPIIYGVRTKELRDKVEIINMIILLFSQHVNLGIIWGYI